MTLETAARLIEQLSTLTLYGTVKSVQGLLVRVTVRFSQISTGNLCYIHFSDKNITPLMAEVVGFDEEGVLIMPFGPIEGVCMGAKVSFSDAESSVSPCDQWLGRVLNGMAIPIDAGESLSQGRISVPIRRSAPLAHARQKISEPIDVGVKAINTFITVCKGQRLGIFSGSGVGKSMLLSMLARYTACDVCVIGLVGERGREVREFIEDTLGPEGLRKSVLVVATSDESPLMRRRAAYTTMAIAEYFRDQGKSVLCLMDSITRIAMAQREIGLSVGEPPTTKGYTPSVFVELAKIMERAGPGIGEGMITAFFTVLVDGDDHNEPIADAARGILDGHIVLDRAIAERAHYPAINILRSLSRTVPACHSLDQQRVVRRARQLLASYEDMADMIRLGAYRTGSNDEVDEAIQIYPQLWHFLAQDHKEQVSLEKSFEGLGAII